MPQWQHHGFHQQDDCARHVFHVAAEIETAEFDAALQHLVDDRLSGLLELALCRREIFGAGSGRHQPVAGDAFLKPRIGEQLFGAGEQRQHRLRGVGLVAHARKDVFVEDRMQPAQAVQV